MDSDSRGPPFYITFPTDPGEFTTTVSLPSEAVVYDYHAHPYEALVHGDEPGPAYSTSTAADGLTITTATSGPVLAAPTRPAGFLGLDSDTPVTEEAFNPHWEDMMNLRQANVTLRLSRAWSEPDSVVTEQSRLLTDGEGVSRRNSTYSSLAAARAHEGPSRYAARVTAWTDASWKRFLVLQLCPVILVVAWFSVPIPVDVVGTDEAPAPGHPAKMNFWFFLLFYYGLYNAVALMLVNQVFRIYALNWWPQSMNAFTANLTTWLTTLAVGAVIYRSTLNLETYTLTWVLLTLTTLLLPVLVSLVVLRSQNRNRHRHVLTEFQKIFLAQTEWRTPSSYRRFLWFAAALSITYAALLAGEYLAYLFLSTLPHNWLAGLLYVYSWVVTVSVLDWVAEWIIEVKIRSWPLIMIYRHYFTLIYFIFYRSLFARLRSLDQFVLVQLGSSLWIVFIYPLRMSRTVHRLLVRLFGIERSYEDYTKQISRTFFLRNYAENLTMMTFLAAVLILHYGPNARFYPYFGFQATPHDGNPEYQYTLSLTLWASTAVWLSELAVSFVTRHIVWLVYGHAIGHDASKDFQRYPEMALAMALVSVHVLQDMLLALIHIDFT
ncbi:hypothetical protein IWQ60_007947 [Tieghemiomyces parasiticus]|uniref:Uncharacterized protein n=1 Tax=Tieghemiomyces parasiticus TaxID=78921 RepID=A0A9W8DT88_9FUNG|nr:hypothetical protein IWQ60_007947 [Tieghemiomyces parasiticus]